MTKREEDLLCADAVIQEINVRLVQSLSLVLFTDQGCHIHIGDIAYFFAFILIVALSAPHDTTYWRNNASDFIISLLTAVLISHL